MDEAIPNGWTITTPRTTLCRTTGRFPASSSSTGGVFNAGHAGPTDRSLAVTATVVECAMVLVLDAVDNDARFLHLTFDVEAWDASRVPDALGEASVRALVDVETSEMLFGSADRTGALFGSRPTVRTGPFSRRFCKASP